MPSQKMVTAFFRTMGQMLCTVSVGEKPLLLVACSGGVDSMVLLHLTHLYCRETGAKCMAVYINHGLRKTAQDDEKLVATTSSRLQIPHAVSRLNPDDIPSKQRRGQEADLRTLRYEALFEQAQLVQASVLLVGHHADDQLETVLWRLIRGTSPTGIGGIRAVSWYADMPILRPLLPFTKSELETYAEAEEIPYNVDETNLSLDYTRNVIRHEVIPTLKQLNPNVVAAVDRFCTIAQTEDEWLELQAQAVVESAITIRDNAGEIDISKLQLFSVPLQRRAIKILLYCLASAPWTFQHVSDILRLMLDSSPSAYIQLPDGWVAQRIYEVIYVGSERADTPIVTDVNATNGQSEVWLPSQGGDRTITLAGVPWQFNCRPWRQEDGVRLETKWAVVTPVVQKFLVRTIRPGDRVSVLGMRGRKKLQDVFVDAKIPKHLRSTWPVICVEDEIVWIPGLIRSGHLLISELDAQGWTIHCQPASHVEAQLQK